MHITFTGHWFLEHAHAHINIFLKIELPPNTEEVNKSCFHMLNDAATTTITNGNTKLYRASLHQMCETKQPSQACNIWECQRYATTSLWCEFTFKFFLILWTMICTEMRPYFLLVFNSFLQSLTLSPTGCFRGNQNQLCWLSYSPRFLWICKSIWPSCPRGHGRQVSIVF